MFNKYVYNELLLTYIHCIFALEEHPLSNSAAREAKIAKAELDTYITDHVSPSAMIIVDDMEPIHKFFID